MAQPNPVFVVTGASRGLGLAIAHYLLKRQCRLVVVARSAAPLEKLQSEYPGQVKTLAGDLANFDLARQAVQTATSEWNQLDGIVANHGVLSPVKRIADAEADEWRGAFDTNVFSIVALIKAALPSLRQSKGRILLVSSGASVNAYTGWAPYGATKAVLNHVALSLSVEEPLVTTLAIRPGTVDTEMQQDIREKHQAVMDKTDHEKFSSLKSSGKLLKPELPGHVIAKLALSAPKDLSGRFLSWNDKDLDSFQS